MKSRTVKGWAVVGRFEGGHRTRMVSAFLTRAEARDEQRDLQGEGEFRLQPVAITFLQPKDGK